MFDQKLSQFSDLPLPDKDRKRTDIICTIIGALFALTMFVLALVFLNTSHYVQSNYPTDSNWISCGYGANANYPFVYFPSVTNINARVCVSVCPTAGTTQLICRPNSVVTSCNSNTIYSTAVNFARLGGFCAPINATQRAVLIKTANLQSKYNFLSIYTSIKISLLIALGLGCLWVLFVQCLPRVMVGVATICAILAIATISILAFIGKVGGASTVVTLVVGIILLCVAIMFACFLCFYQRRNKLVPIFLDWSAKFFKEQCVHFILTFVFVLLTAGLIFLCLFQHIAYISHNTPLKVQGNVYLQLNPNYVLFVLNLIEFIWGLQFLKDAYNFMVSGLATQWYTKADVSSLLILKRLLKYHFGSIVGGSFLNGFFNIINFMLQSVRCYRDGACPACASCYECCCGCNRNFFELVRTDVYAYVNLTGIAHCNAARNCQYLIENSHLFVGCQSLLYFYRISAYCFLVGVTIIFTIFIQDAQLGGKAYVVSLLFSMLLSYCLLNYFVDLHPNVAEGVQISYLIEESLGGRGNKQLGAIGGNKYEYKDQIRLMQKSYNDGVFC